MGLTAVPKPPRREPKPRKPLVRRTPLRPVRKGKPPRKSTLRQGRSTPPATAAQKLRWALMRDIGCICCLQLRVRAPLDVEIHHLTLAGLAGQRRLGHDSTVALCAWHHRGTLAPGCTGRAMEWKFGPSLAHGSKPFRRTFGTDCQLLEYQHQLLEGNKP